MRFYLNLFLVLIFVSLSYAVYQIGDQISADDQARQHEICYGAEEHGFEEGNHGTVTLSLGDFNGYTNESGIFYVTMIDMAASW